MFVRGVLELDVAVVQWFRVSTVHGETRGRRGNPDSNLRTRGVVRTDQIVTLLTLVVGNLSICSSTKLGLPISYILWRLANDWFALGNGPGPGPILSTQNHVSSVILQLVSRITVECQNCSLNKQLRKTSCNVAILDSKK